MKPTEKKVKQEFDALGMLIERRSDIYRVDPRLIKVTDGLNPREDYGDISELKAEIKAAGKILNNSIGYRENGVIHLINGHRRNLAACELINSGEMPELRQPIAIIDKPNELDILKIIVLTNRGKNFTPLEDANTMLRMFNLGITPKDIAKEFGKTDAHVCNNLALAKLPARLKSRINSNEISSTLVLNLVRENKEMNIDQLATKVETILDKAKVMGKKVTKSVMDKEMQKINSLSELKKALKNVSEDTVTNKDLFTFCMGIIGNQLDAIEIQEMLGVKTLTAADLMEAE